MNVTPYFYLWTATHVLQFSSITVPLNFVWLPHNALSLIINLVFLSYITLILCGLAHLFFSFLSGTFPSPLSLCECHTCASPFSLCECHTNILVSPLLLSGHSTLFPFRSWLTHSRSNLVWAATPHFLKKNYTRATSFLSFDNITNLFTTTFIFPM